MDLRQHRANSHHEYVEQARATLRAAPTTIVSGQIVACSVAYLLAGVVPPATLGGWLAAITVLTVFRLAMVAGARRTIDRAPRPFLFAVTAAGGAAGATWAVLPWLLIGHSHGLQGLYASFVLGGVSAGALTSSPAWRWYVFAFITPILLSMATAFVAVDVLWGKVLALDTILFAALLAKSAANSERHFLTSIRIAAEQRATAAALGESNARLQELAARDPLTGLLNRNGFAAELEARFAAVRRDRTELALLIVDLDDFKSINDSRGHAAGDQALTAAAGRLVQVSGTQAAIGRLGGDEFALVFSGPDAAALATDHAGRIMTAIGAPIAIEEGVTILGASTGLAVHPTDARDSLDLFSHADIALYAAKNDGRGRLCRFERSMLNRIEERRRIEADLPAALRDGAVIAYFQPKISLTDGGIAGCEALLRWRHPTLGWVSPPKVVAAARATRSGELLTRRILEAAVKARSRMVERGLTPVPIAVNVSPIDLTSYSVAALIRDVAGDDVAGIEIEITEDARLDLDLCEPRIEELRAMGVSIAVDDFGSGFTSLAYLSRLRADRLKIDRQFLADFDQLQRNTALIQAMVGLGGAMGMEVVAEGVETAAVAARLAELGCRVAQGFHFARPLPEAEFLTFLEKLQTPAAPPTQRRTA